MGDQGTADGTRAPSEDDEPSTQGNPRQQAPPAPEDESDGAPVCCICFGEIEEPSARLHRCTHAMCLDCYARASVREVGETVHCPQCANAGQSPTSPDPVYTKHNVISLSATPYLRVHCSVWTWINRGKFFGLAFSVGWCG